MSTIEAFGYAASVTVAASLMLRNLVWLRALNSVGALMFVAYGVMIHAKPVVILNGFILVADLYYLYQLTRRPAEAPPAPL